MAFPFIPDNTQQSYFGSMPDMGQSAPQVPDEQQPESTQIQLPVEELRRIRQYIDAQRSASQIDYARLKSRWRDQKARWREKVGTPQTTPSDSNFRFQLIPALMYAKHAREVMAVFGGKASISGVPVGPSDSKMAGRAALALSWQFFENMDGEAPLALCLLRRLEHGRSFCKVDYQTQYYSKFASGERQRIAYKSAPVITPIDNDDIMMPADTQGVQSCAWVCLRYRTTPTDMLLHSSEPGGAAAEGDWYQGIEDKFDKLLQISQRGIRRDSERDSIKQQQDWDEGLNREMSSSLSESIECEEWHIRWRMMVDEEAVTGNDETMSPMEDGDEPEAAGQKAKSLPPGTYRDTEGVLRERIETDLLVRVVYELPGDEGIVGVQRLDELYPDTPIKRPIMEFSFLNDGSYWCMGLIELVEEIEAEMTNLVNKLIEAVGLSIAPPIFAEPTVGDNFMTRKYGCNDLIPTANASGVKQMQISPQVEGFTQLWLLFQSIYELLTGITNLSMGRGMDQPNAPRTLGGQRLVMGAADVRQAMDMRNVNTQLKALLNWVWDLWRMFGDEGEAFRVAEKDMPRGEFEHGEVDNGFVQMSAVERNARYDFSFEFADDMAVRETKKQDVLATAQLLATMPFFEQNLEAQYLMAREICEVMGIDTVVLGQPPPEQFLPKTPDEEWSLLLQGDTVHVHPQDDDAAHLDDHSKRVMAEMNSQNPDVDAILRMREHMAEHQQQLIQKQQAQTVIEGIKGLIQTAQAGVQGAQRQQQNPIAGLLQGAMGGGGGMGQGAMPQ